MIGSCARKMQAFLMICEMRIQLALCAFRALYSFYETAQESVAFVRVRCQGPTNCGKSLSAVIEAQLLAAPSAGALEGDYWHGPALKPLSRPGDACGAYLKRKHGL